SGVPLAVASVAPGSAAERAGLQAGDRLATIDGAPVAAELHLAAAVLRAEQSIALQIVRGEERLAVDVPLDGQPTQLGLSWREDDAEPGAVFIARVTFYSPAARAGLVVHDRIYAFEGRSFASSDELLGMVRDRLAESPAALRLEVESRGRLRAVAIDLLLPGQAPPDATL
ncbi:MAG TPA: PDZ domain-containing protein, partial [Lacipirellulaceae bacterium]|nr:PDZ domain-containing protein [Lacipirellulaceae bacterium]